MLYLAENVFHNLERWNEINAILLSLTSLILSLIIGARLSIYTYEITLNKEGLEMKIISPFNFLQSEIKSIAWEQMEAYNFEEYGNGTILNFSLITGEKYSFTNSIFKKSEDTIPFYEALKLGADAFNEAHKHERKEISKMPGFYAGTFAYIIAIFLGIMLLIIPVLIFYTKSLGSGSFQFLKLSWLYLLSLLIIWNVYKERRKKNTV